MRCLTLADAVRRRGGRATFVCRSHVGHLGDRIAAAGHGLHLISPSDGTTQQDTDTALQEDVAATTAALAAVGCDWLVVDHYSLGADWHRAVRPPLARVMVIDDLADRAHACDLLLDQNLGRVAVDYDGLVPDAAKRLIGPRYALLRPDFSAARVDSLVGRAARGGQVRDVLIAMGGTDPDNASGAVLKTLAPLLRSLRVTVVLGSGAPHLDQVRTALSDLGSEARLLTDVSDMARLMVQADLAIGAAGGTSWERCCLGLPALVLVLADNQRGGAAALDRAGAAILCGDLRQDDWRARLTAAFSACLDATHLTSLSQAAAGLVDGEGADRVAAAMVGDRALARLRPTRSGDAEAVWHWRQSMLVEFLESGKETPLADHISWFTRALVDPARLLLTATVADAAVGHLRLDMKPDETATVSIVLDPSARGRGLGIAALAALSAHARALGLRRLVARIHKDNTASQRLFHRAGYLCIAQVGLFSEWEIELARPAEPGKELS